MKLSSIFSDGLILQRDECNRVWGYSTADENVSITIEADDYSEKISVLSNEDGYFEANLSARPAGGPYRISFCSVSECVYVNDVYFGDVFLLAGQSNMELPISRTLDETEDYIKQVNRPLIRQFEVPKDTNFYTEVDELKGGHWVKAVCPEIYNFSALGYFFAEQLQKDENIPVGLYQTACGGIQIEALMSEKRIKGLIPKLKEIAASKGETKEKDCHCGKNNYCKFCIEEKMQDDIDDHAIKMDQNELAAIYEEFYGWLNMNDEGLLNGWEKKTSLYSSDEKVKYINVPARWEQMPEYPGIEYLRGSVWLLKCFEVPEEYAGRPAKLKFGTVIDADDTYINGVHVGKTDYRYPPRRYEVPAGLLKAGENVLVIRIVASQRTGGTVPEMPYELNLEGGFTILLNGLYEMRIGAARKYGCREDVVNMPDPTFYLFRPYGLYNKMIHPLRKCAIKAMLFYQGESNVGRNWDYELLAPEMVAGIRELFGRPKLPFIFVGLPYWGQEDDDRGTDKWDQFIESQKKLISIPYSQMIDIYDLGFKYELHPQNKRSVGCRVYQGYKKYNKSSST